MSNNTIRYTIYKGDDEVGYHTQNLGEWLIKNPAEFTHKKFSVGDTIKLNKRRGLVKVIQTLQGNFFPEYLIKLKYKYEKILGTTRVVR